MAFNFQQPLSRFQQDPRYRQVTLAGPPADPVPVDPYPDPASGQFPNLIDTAGANVNRRLMEDWTDYITNRNDAGMGLTPMPAVNMAFDSNRDPETGTYLSQTLTPDWGGAPQVMQQMGQTYLDPIQSSLTFGVGELNKHRDAAIAASPTSTYTDSRISTIVDPRTGFRTYQLVPQTNTVPFLPMSSRFAL